MKKIIFALLGFTVLTACSKSDFTSTASDTQSDNVVIFTTELSADTKTTMDGSGKFTWESTDEVAFFDGNTVSTAQPQNINGSKATFVVTGLSSTATNYYAVFPSSIANDASKFLTGTNINLKSSPIQSKSTSFWAVATCTETNKNLSFKNVGAIIKITPPSGATQVSFCGTGMSVTSGPTVNPSTGDIVTAGSSSNTSVIYTLTSGETAAYINIDAVDNTTGTTLSNGYTSCAWNANGIIGSYIVSDSKAFKRGYWYTLDLASKYIAGIVPGEFSITNDTKVRFSKSNLYWSSSAWKFEANQYDYPTTYETSHVGHLFWTRSADNSYTESYSETDPSVEDHFFADGSDADHKLTVDGTSGWYTMSRAEWQYLLNIYTYETSTPSRTNASDLYKNGVTVCNKTNCLIIAPDGYDYTTYPLQEVYNTESSEDYPLTWAQAEAAGLVCLPAASYRSDDGVDEDYSSYGFYWSSSTYDNGFDDWVCYLSFEFDCEYEYDDVGMTYYNSRGDGQSVRLVRK